MIPTFYCLSLCMLCCHPLWSRNLAPHSTTDEEPGCIWPVMAASHTTYSPVGLYFQRRGPLMYWSATTHPHYPYQLLITMHMQIGPWTTVRCSESPWPRFHETGIRPLTDRVTPDSGWSGSTLCRSALVWQLPVIRHRTDVHAASL